MQTINDAIKIDFDQRNLNYADKLYIEFFGKEAFYKLAIKDFFKKTEDIKINSIKPNKNKHYFDKAWTFIKNTTKQ